jgi:hypothetical protein
MDDRWLYLAYLSNVALAVGGWQLFLTDITPGSRLPLGAGGCSLV